MRNLFLVLFVCIGFSSNAQYSQSIGLRGGLRGVGFTYNYYLGPKPFINIDVMGTKSQQLQGGLAFLSFNLREEIHSSTLNTTRLSWSYGGGIHGGYFRDPTNTANQSDIVLGPDLRLAMEFQSKFDIVFGIDVTGYYNVMPLINSDNPKGWQDEFVDAGVFIKYVID